ncbi:signal peptidase II [Paramicrobacterium humi]|uniref:Lipoprotein signal peptidase n=1 Tax=Paramicrobacterium humi TaxID=640635 RepID=A0A1H4R9Z8_9MICO|nr:signal peptidase II [Microbacterium humi]SEC61005.1 signal peptidase II [Microbacterium humi]
MTVAALWFALDQWTKHLVVTSMTEGEQVPVLGNVLQLVFVRNSGAAFSLASGATWIFSILASIVVVVIIVLARRIRSPWWALVFGLLLGGVLGNLSDRLFREPSFGLGHVVDFISTPWMMPAIYNVADIGIVSAMVLFVLLTILGIGLDGVRHAKTEADPQQTPSGEIGHDEQRRAGD